MFWCVARICNTDVAKTREGHCNQCSFYTWRTICDPLFSLFSLFSFYYLCGYFFFQIIKPHKHTVAGISKIKNKDEDFEHWCGDEESGVLLVWMQPWVDECNKRTFKGPRIHDATSQGGSMGHRESVRHGNCCAGGGCHVHTSRMQI